MNNLDFRDKVPNPDNPLVTIGVLSYNNAKYILECLESIKNQTYSPIELIINDDFSDDNSVDLIDKWLKQNNLNTLFIKSNKNRGITKSSNKIISNISGEYFCLIGSDDLMTINRIELCVDKFQKIENDYGFIYSDMHYIDEESNQLEMNWNHPFFKGYCYKEYFFNKFRMPAPTLFYRSRIFNDLLFDSTLIAEDIDFQSRALYSWKVDFLDEKTILYRHSSPSSQKRKSKITYYEHNLYTRKVKIKHLRNLPFKEKKALLLSYLSNIKSLVFNKKFLSFHYAIKLIWYLIISQTILRNYVLSKKFFFSKPVSLKKNAPL
jgi:glycosyltransferase involved in cell wall biosynthesis